MSAEDYLSDEQKAARDQLHDLLQKYAKLLGPWREDEDMDPVPENVFLSEWVLVANWVDEDGEGYLTRIPSRKLPMHSRDGLLHQGLYGFGD